MTSASSSSSASLTAPSSSTLTTPPPALAKDSPQTNGELSTSTPPDTSTSTQLILERTRTLPSVTPMLQPPSSHLKKPLFTLAELHSTSRSAMPLLARSQALVAATRDASTSQHSLQPTPTSAHSPTTASTMQPATLETL